MSNRKRLRAHLSLLATGLLTAFVITLGLPAQSLSYEENPESGAGCADIPFMPGGYNGECNGFIESLVLMVGKDCQEATLEPFSTNSVQKSDAIDVDPDNTMPPCEESEDDSDLPIPSTPEAKKPKEPAKKSCDDSLRGNDPKMPDPNKITGCRSYQECTQGEGPPLPPLPAYSSPNGSVDDNANSNVAGECEPKPPCYASAAKKPGGGDPSPVSYRGAGETNVDISGPCGPPQALVKSTDPEPLRGPCGIADPATESGGGGCDHTSDFTNDANPEPGSRSNSNSSRSNSNSSEGNSANSRNSRGSSSPNERGSRSSGQGEDGKDSSPSSRPKGSDSGGHLPRFIPPRDGYPPSDKGLPSSDFPYPAQRPIQPKHYDPDSHDNTDAPENLTPKQFEDKVKEPGPTAWHHKYGIGSDGAYYDPSNYKDEKPVSKRLRKNKFEYKLKREYDTNGDGKTDRWDYDMSSSSGVKGEATETDTDYDGDVDKIEAKYKNKNGDVFHVEKWDTNGDGKMDLDKGKITSPDGTVVKFVVTDTNYDGKYDRQDIAVVYPNGTMHHYILTDANYDGIYEKQEGTIIYPNQKVQKYVLTDTNNDGKYDTWDGKVINLDGTTYTFSKTDPDGDGKWK